MDIASEFESHTVCICRHAFLTDFSCKINFKSNFNESVDFLKNALTSLFSKKNAKKSHGLGKIFPVSNILKSVTSRHCSNDTKEADILDLYWLPLKGVKLKGV